MATADDLAQQKRLADTQKREAQAMIVKQRALLREQANALDREIHALQTQKSHTLSELSKLG